MLNRVFNCKGSSRNVLSILSLDQGNVVCVWKKWQRERERESAEINNLGQINKMKKITISLVDFRDEY